MRASLALLVCGIAVVSAGGLAAAGFPQVESVERQPLAAAFHRLEQALDRVGSPLPEATVAAVATALAASDDATATGGVQAALDPLCLVAVVTGGAGAPRVVATPAAAELVEQGWRRFLVKVVNAAEIPGRLVVASPQARPLPTAPAAEVADRWLAIESFDAQPLTPTLTGLPLEYRLVHLFARDAGTATARIEAAVVPPAGKADEAARGGAEVAFRIRPSIPVTFRISDDADRPVMGRFEITDPSGRVYPPQAKRLAPDLFFQRQIYRGDGESVRLPAGRYTIACSRGPETLTETREVVVGTEPIEVAYTVRRWIDPSRRGYWSGDHHIHAAGCAHYESPTEGVEPIDMLRQCMGEDLKVGCCLTWGPCFDYQKRFFTGRPDDVSRPPYLLRYDIEVSGFGSHVSGHLNLLRLTEQIPPGGDSKHHWPSLGLNTLRWAQRQGAVCGPAHSANGLTNVVGRLPGTDGRDGPGRLPNFDIPAFDGIGANEFIADVPHEVPGPDGTPVPAVDFISTMDTDPTAEFNIWYHVLNCGYRVRASGETDFPCISGERVGLGRVYVRLDGPLDFDRWCDGLAAGRSYVSDGRTHLMEFSAQSADADPVEAGTGTSELHLDGAGEIRVRGLFAAAAAGGTLPVELVVNGRAVERLDLPADGREHELALTTRIEKSSWVALRSFPRVHTNPVFVLVAGKPIRADADSARWAAACVTQCWKTKEASYRPEERVAAREAFDFARTAYERIAAECGE